MHPDKTKIVYCKDEDRKGENPVTRASCKTPNFTRLYLLINLIRIFKKINRMNFVLIGFLAVIFTVSLNLKHTYPLSVLNYL
jgi:membrane-anchored glycerophosphoryl diester phosphodiesterase (GDPDase)